MGRLIGKKKIQEILGAPGPPVSPTRADQVMTNDPLFPDPKEEWHGKRYERQYDEDEVKEYARNRPPRQGGRPKGADAARRAEARRRKGWE